MSSAVGAVILFAVIQISLSPCSGKAVPASFVFGDSLVDCGNNNYIPSLSKANYHPFGIDFLPLRTATGRYTNGRTIADIIGQELGLIHFTPPYLAPSTTGNVILLGVNYASGGGGILNATGSIFGGRINMDAQIDNYANNRQEIISRLGHSASSSLLTKSIFSIVMGANDFINNYLSPGLSQIEREMLAPQEFIDALISRCRLQLTRLYDLEARKFVVVNVGPIGCIPYQRDLNPTAGDNCAIFPNQLAQAFNQQLRNLVAELSSKLEGAFFVYADVYHIVTDIIRNYTRYGFENVNSACCSVAGRYGGLVPCGPSSKVCVDRSKFVFWDPYHPSDASNEIIAKRLVHGSSDDIFPMNVRQLVEA